MNAIKKLFLLISPLIFFLSLANSQSSKVTISGSTPNVMLISKGTIRSDSGIIMTIGDTLNVKYDSVGSFRLRPADWIVYIKTPTKWQPIWYGSALTWQQSLDITDGSILTHNNSVNMSDSFFTYNNVGEFIYNMANNGQSSPIIYNYGSGGGLFQLQNVSSFIVNSGAGASEISFSQQGNGTFQATGSNSIVLQTNTATLSTDTILSNLIIPLHDTVSASYLIAQDNNNNTYRIPLNNVIGGYATQVGLNDTSGVLRSLINSNIGDTLGLGKWYIKLYQPDTALAPKTIAPITAFTANNQIYNALVVTPSFTNTGGFTGDVSNAIQANGNVISSTEIVAPLGLFSNKIQSSFYTPYNNGKLISNGSIVGGSGYTNGTYTNQTLTSSTGTLGGVTITVSGGAVTTITYGTSSNGFNINDVITWPAGTGTGFSTTATNVQNGAYWYNTANTLLNMRLVDTTGDLIIGGGNNVLDSNYTLDVKGNERITGSSSLITNNIKSSSNGTLLINPYQLNLTATNGINVQQDLGFSSGIYPYFIGSGNGTTSLVATDPGVSTYTQTVQARNGTIANLDQVLQINTTSNGSYYTMGNTQFWSCNTYANMKSALTTDITMMQQFTVKNDEQNGSPIPYSASIYTYSYYSGTSTWTLSYYNKQTVSTPY